jgi:EAL domain-containing protein (putative c-di-GMP-specific phosphodiesterase class I)/ActR/RegA family two-component response regulator
LKARKLNRGRAIVVDDDPISCEICSAALRSLGYSSSEHAANGAECLALIAAGGEPVRLIISDLNMPVMDGLTFMRGLKDVAFTGSIIVLSSMGSSILSLSASLGETHGLDVLGALSKPLKFNSLAALLAKPKVKVAAKPWAGTAAPSFTPAQLQAGFEAGQIVGYFQPKVSPKTGLVKGAEVLARWQHPEHGLISPQAFISLAEEAGLIGALTSSLAISALQATARMRSIIPEFKVSVNMSADAFLECAIVDDIASWLASAGLSGSALVIEITETQHLETSSQSLESLGRLRLMGIGLSMDDFGTGYSNLAGLQAFPFTELKIDRSFVTSVATSEVAKNSVIASVELGHSQGLNVVAEGIETAEQVYTLAAIGVDEIQGYFVSRPVAESAFLAWLASCGAHQTWQRG